MSRRVQEGAGSGGEFLGSPALDEAEESQHPDARGEGGRKRNRDRIPSLTDDDADVGPCRERPVGVVRRQVDVVRTVDARVEAAKGRPEEVVLPAVLADRATPQKGSVLRGVDGHGTAAVGGGVITERVIRVGDMEGVERVEVRPFARVAIEPHLPGEVTDVARRRRVHRVAAEVETPGRTGRVEARRAHRHIVGLVAVPVVGILGLVAGVVADVGSEPDLDAVTGRGRPARVAVSASVDRSGVVGPGAGVQSQNQQSHEDDQPQTGHILTHGASLLRIVQRSMRRSSVYACMYNI